MIDTHIHADARSGEDFKEMYLAGIDCAITCSYYPYKIDSEIILLNHLNRILELDTRRALEHGLDLKVALGIHPTNALENPESIYNELYKLCPLPPAVRR
jgi:predicted metal-dependent TIM-barrel fold hydrolase